LERGGRLGLVCRARGSARSSGVRRSLSAL